MPVVRYLSLFFCVPLLMSYELCRAAETLWQVQPPQWSQDVLDAFFEDARERLVGTRPKSTPRQEDAQWIAESTTGGAAGSDVKLKWSTLIDEDTLTAEIRRINNQLATPLKNSASFQGGGNLDCRRDFGMLTVLFGVIKGFDQVNSDQFGRWQRSAQQMQARCFQTSNNCKTSSAQSFAAAKSTHALLEDLFRGQATTAEAKEYQSDEEFLIDRPQLMQSMELALKERLSSAMANAREFRKRSQLASEQAQSLAVLAEVIQQQGYEYTDDDTYLDEARQLREAARELTQAAREKNYEAARAAAGKLGQCCSRCHEGYRG